MSSMRDSADELLVKHSVDNLEFRLCICLVFSFLKSYFWSIYQLVSFVFMHTSVKFITLRKLIPYINFKFKVIGMRS